MERRRIVSIRDYAQLMKPRIAGLLLLVAIAGYVSTKGPRIDPRIDLWPLVALLVCGFLAAGGASAVNHFLDRDVDAMMARTRGRPLPQHRIDPPVRALAFGLALTIIALVGSYAFVNALTAGMIALGFVFYVGVYTLGLKRAHASNIVIGGFAGSCAALAGSAAASNSISLPSALIALLVFLWTPGHFWSLAYRAREDYRRAGIPMLPAVRNPASTVRAIVFSTVLVPASTFAFLFAPSFRNVAYLTVALVAGAILLVLTVQFLRRPTPQAAWAEYKFSGTYLALILVGMILGAIWFASP